MALHNRELLESLSEDELVELQRLLEGLGLIMLSCAIMKDPQAVIVLCEKLAANAD
jgi:hypothetical protein